MDVDLVARLEEKAAYHAREAERYRTAADVLRSELRGSRSARSSDKSSGAASTTSMVEAALNDAPGPLHAGELVEAMRRLGWQTDAKNMLNTARTAAYRLAEQGRIERRPDGTYARLGLVQPEASPSSADPIDDDDDDDDGPGLSFARVSGEQSV